MKTCVVSFQNLGKLKLKILNFLFVFIIKNNKIKLQKNIKDPTIFISFLKKMMKKE